MNISSNENSKVISLDHTKESIYSSINTFISSLGNPIDEEILASHVETEMLYTLSIMILGLHCSPNDTVVSNTLFSDQIFLNNLEGEEDFHASYRFLSTQINKNYNEKIKVTYGGDIETFKELARSFIRGENAIEFINSHMIVDSIDMGSYANNFIKICETTPIYHPSIRLPFLFKKLEKELQAKELLKTVDSFSGLPNPSNTPIPTIGAVEIKDIKHSTFTYSTDYDALSSIREFFCPSTYKSDTNRIAGEEINNLAFRIGIKKSTPVEVDMYHNIYVSLGDPNDDDNFEMSAIEMRQGDIARYFINFNFDEMYGQPQHDNYNPEVTRDVFLAFLRENKVIGPLDHFTSKIEKELLEEKVTRLRPAIIGEFSNNTNRKI